MSLITIKNQFQLESIFKKYNISKESLKSNNNIIINIIKDVSISLNKFQNKISRNSIKYYNIKNYKINYESTNYTIILKYFMDVMTKANSLLNDIYNDKYELNNNTNIWNIFLYKGMIFELPFTMDDIIFLPENYVINSMNDKNNFIKTLIHEKIHILQRANIYIWNDYIYKNNKEWIIISTENILYDLLSIENLSKLTEKIIIINPDTDYDFKYIYKKNNNLYYGITCLENDKVNYVWFQIVNNDIMLIDEIIYKYEHPYEMYAYVISENLIK